MRPGNYEQALLEVERSELPVLDLLPNVAEIINLDLNELQEAWAQCDCKAVVPKPVIEFFRKTRIAQEPETTFMPKEEWALRWLLKRLPGPSKEEEQETGELLGILEDARAFIILHYLVQILPDRSVNRIINDRKSFSKLAYWLESLLRILPKDDPVHSFLAADGQHVEVTENEPTDDEFTGSPAKRRKISPSYETMSLGSYSNTKSGHFEWLGILLCNIVAELAWPSAIDELDTTSLPAYSTWNIDATTAARIASLSLEVIWTSPETLRDEERVQFIFLMQRICSIWDQCCARDETTTPEDRARLFQQHLSARFLFFRRTLVTWREEHSLEATSKGSSDRSPPDNASKCSALASGCIKYIDRSVCVNAILPLRKVMRAIKIHDWRSDRTAVAWRRVQEPIERVSEWAKAAELVGSMAEVAPDFLDLAIRMIPDKSSTQYQQERLWLEGFFLGLIYLSSPEAPQMELDEEGCLTQRVSTPLELTSKSGVLTTRLLQVASHHRFIPSLPLLSYITSVVLQTSEYSVLLSSIATLIKMNPDVLIPNSGLDNSKHCFDVLCSIIAEADAIDDLDYQVLRDQIVVKIDAIHDPDYLVLRDQIIIPLAKAFAHARDLPTFVKKWSLELQAALRYFDTEDYGLRNRPLLVWQDEDIFAALSELARDHGRPNITEDIFEQTIQSLGSVNSRSESQYHTLAHVAILDCMLSSRPGDAEILHLDLQKLSDTVVSALSDQHTYDSQFWRLWSLLKTSTEDLQQETKANLNTKLDDLETFFSISQLSITRGVQDQISRSMFLTEALHCFRLTAMLVHGQRDFNITNVRIRTELEGLIKLYDGTNKRRHIDDSDNRASRISWSGRWQHLQTNQDLIDGCIGVLLQYPNCFRICSDLTPVLVSKIGTYALHETKHDGKTNDIHQKYQPDLESRKQKLDSQYSAKIFEKALAIMDTNAVSRNRHLFLECIKALMEVFKNESDMGQSSVFRRTFLHRLPQSLLQELAINKPHSSGQPSEHDETNAWVKFPDDTPNDISSTPLTKAQLRKVLTETYHSTSHDAEDTIAEDPQNSFSEGQGSAIPHSIHAAITLLHLKDVDFEKRQPLALHLSRWAALQYTHTVKSGKELCIMLDICKLALSRRPKLVNQATVDDLLAMLAILTSKGYPRADKFNKDPSTAIFDRLTGIIAVLLTRFRIRLQSRYHLLLPCLQNLLQCIYFPGTEIVESRKQQNEHQLEFLDHLPPWLTGTSQSLPPSSAAKFSRLLTSICDPSASAAARISSNTSELNDATKKARSIAGQYMQYLIMEYAYCTLSGQTGSPAVTARLMPGLYACLDCMPRELVSCMNDAMDPSSRAVFKGLWEDYGKFGKWDKR